MLRLGAYKLPAAEVVLVQTLFRLYAHGDTFNWTFVTAPPYDALLADGTTDEGASPEVDRMARAVLRLTRANPEAPPNTLPRPIRADHLLNWLKAVEREWQNPSAPAPASAKPAAPAPAAPVSAVKSAPASPAPSASADTVAKPRSKPTSSAPPSPVRYKLRRWPPAAMLRNDPHRIRMATLLSRRALNAAELADISGQPVGECQAFLQLLHSTGLVLPHPDPATAAASAPANEPTRAAAPAPAPAAPKPTFARSLISGIRRRLGL